MIFINKADLDKRIEMLKISIAIEAHLGQKLFKIIKGGHLPIPEQVLELMTDAYYNKLLDFFPVFNTVFLTNFRRSIFQFQEKCALAVYGDSFSFEEFRTQWITDEEKRVQKAIEEVESHPLLLSPTKALYKINLAKHIKHISGYKQKLAPNNISLSHGFSDPAVEAFNKALGNFFEEVSFFEATAERKALFIRPASLLCSAVKTLFQKGHIFGHDFNSLIKYIVENIAFKEQRTQKIKLISETTVREYFEKPYKNNDPNRDKILNPIFSLEIAPKKAK